MATIKKICICNGLRNVFYLEDVDEDTLTSDEDTILAMDDELGGEGLGDTLLTDED